MKKKIFILGLFIVLFLSTGFLSFAKLEDYPPEVDIDELRIKMNINTAFKGKTFKDGAIGYYYRVAVKSDDDANKNVWCSKNVKICSLSTTYSMNGTLNRFKFQLKRKPPVSTFVAFDNSGTKKGYEYTLLNGLGYTTDTYSNDRSDSIEFKCLWTENDYTLYSSEMKEDTSTITLNVDSTKQKAQVMLFGDVYAANVELTQLQKLWFGDNSVWKVNVRMYVFSNLRIEAYCF